MYQECKNNLTEWFKTMFISGATGTRIYPRTLAKTIPETLGQTSGKRNRVGY